jgi:hypothetical protein
MITAARSAPHEIVRLTIEDGRPCNDPGYHRIDGVSDVDPQLRRRPPAF